MHTTGRTSEVTQDSIENSHNKTEVELKSFVAQELAKMTEAMNYLIERRHELFDVNGTEYDPALPISDQLYDETAYNLPFIDHDLGLRAGNSLDYHQTTEKYDRGLSDEHAERDAQYRQAILSMAQERGFVAKHPGSASHPVDKNIGILDSELEPIEENVAAVVINGAAGMSNVKRIRDAIRNIESGAVKTDRIILTAGTRPVDDGEKARMKAPYRAGDTEYESMKLAVTDLLGVEFDDAETSIHIGYGEAKVQKVTVAIGDRLVTIDAVEVPFDTNRTLDNGTPAKRVNTEEVFLATLPLLEGTDGAIVMESHDTWTPWQNLIGHKIFGLEQGRAVYPAGPFNAERVYTVTEDGTEVTDITAPQDVLDEMVKTFRQLVRMSLE